MPRMKPSTRALLDLLTRTKGAWTDHAAVAATGGHRYSARIMELREAGYTIEQEGGGERSRYRLVSGPPSPFPGLACACGWQGREPQALRDLDGILCPRCSRRPVVHVGAEPVALL